MVIKRLIAEEFCDSVRDGTHGTPKPVEVGYKLITGKHIKGGVVIPEDAYNISESDYLEINKRSKVNRWDVLMSMIGTVGELALVKDEPDYAIKNIALFKCGQEVKARWLFYYLSSPEGKGQLKSGQVGGAQQFLSLNKIRNLQIPVPETATMQKIVSILSAYDSLIENNRRQIKLLEEAAQRLYKEWFVDLRFPGHEHTPIINGIPQGWQRHIFADLIQKEIGGGWGKECEEGRYDVSAYVIRGTDIEHVSVGEYAVPYRYHTRTNFDARKLRNGDIIFEVSGGGKNEGVAKTLRVTSGMLGMWEERAICASFCKLVRLQDDVHSCYISDALKYLRATKQTESYENRSASSIINFRWTDFLNNQEFIIPEKNTMLQYYEMSNAVYEKQVALARSISCATEARDRLLPKLMSGEVEV